MTPDKKQKSQEPSQEWEDDYSILNNGAIIKNSKLVEGSIDCKESTEKCLKEIIQAAGQRGYRQGQKDLVVKWEKAIGDTRKLINEAKAEAYAEIEEMLKSKFRDELEMIATRGTLTPCGETTLKVLEEICADILQAIKNLNDRQN